MRRSCVGAPRTVAPVPAIANGEVCHASGEHHGDLLVVGGSRPLGAACRVPVVYVR
jgi:hypothetical protein